MSSRMDANRGNATSGQSSGARLSALYKQFKTGVLGVLFFANKRVSIPGWLTYVALCVRILQMLSFLTGDKAGATWPAALGPLEYVSSFTNLRGYAIWLEVSIIRAAFWVATAWVLLLLLLLTWGISNFARNKFPALWPLRLLRIMGNLSAGVLFIPLLQCLLSLQEEYEGRGDPLQPFVTAVTVILGVILTSLSLLFAAVFYEASMLSPRPSSKAHGRCDVVLLCLQCALVVQARYTHLAVWLRVAILLACGLSWLFAYLYALPFYAHTLNRMHVAGALIYLWGITCLILNVTYRATDAAVMLYCGIPLAIGAGLALADWRAGRIMSTQSSRLSSPYEVELKGRYIVHAVLWGHPLHKRSDRDMSRVGAVMWSNGAGAASLRGGLALNDQPGMSVGPGQEVQRLSDTGKKSLGDFLGSGLPGMANRLPRLASKSNGLTMATGIGPSGGGAALHGAEHGVAADATAHDFDPLLGEDGDEGGGGGDGLRALLPIDVVSEVLAMYRSAASRMRSSALIHVFCARLYGHVLGNRHMQMSHLLQAERRQPSLDLSFVVFAARRTAEDGGGERISAMNRVAWEKYASEARRQVKIAAEKQLNFWAELMDPCPDLSRLHRLSSDTNAAIQGAEHAFAELTVINPQSLAMIRLYAAFNLHVTCNGDKAGVLLAEADRLEDAKSKEHRAEGAMRMSIMAETPLDVWAENTAVVMISAARRDVGNIRSVNAAACRLFGYTRLQLERRSIFTLLPPGLTELHEDSLRQYVATGEGIPGVVGYSRVIFALNKAGTLVAVISAVRDAPAEDGPPSFVWAMRELRTSMHYILLDSRGGIMGLSPGSQALLGLDPSTLSTSEVTMVDFIAEWSSAGVMEELCTQAGSTVRVDIAHSAGAGRSAGSSSGANMTPRSPTPRNGAALALSRMGSQGARIQREEDAESTGVAGEDDDDSDDDDEDEIDDQGGHASGTKSTAARDARLGRFRRESHTVTKGARSIGHTTVAVRRASILAGGFAQTSVDTTWARAFLQPIGIGPRGAQPAFVLHWQAIDPKDTVSIAKAEAKRTSFLGIAVETVYSGRMGAAASSSDDNRSGSSIHGVISSPSMTAASFSLTHPESESISKSMSMNIREAGRLDKGRDAVLRSKQAVLAESPTREPDHEHLPGAVQASIPAVGSIRPSSVSGVITPTDADLDGMLDQLAISETPLGDPGGIGGARNMLVNPTSLSAARTLPRSSTMPATGPMKLPDAGFADVTEAANTPILQTRIPAGLGRTASFHPGPGSVDDAEYASRTVSRTYPTPSLKVPASQVMRADTFERSSAVSLRERELNIAKGDKKSVRDDDAPSQKDGQSAGSGSSGIAGTTRAMSRLRRILGVDTPAFLPGLQWLRYAGGGLTLLGIVLASVVTSITQSNFTLLLNQIEYVGLGASRMVHKASAILNAQELMFYGRSWLNLTEGERLDARTNMLESTAMFSEIHRRMFALMQNTPSVAFWTKRYITATLFGVPPNGVGGRYVHRNLMESGEAFAALMKDMASSVRMPDAMYSLYADGCGLGEPRLAQLSTEWSRAGNGHETLQASMSMGFATAIETFTFVRSTQAYVFAGMAITIALVGLLIFVPILKHIDSSADTVMLQFVRLPVPVRRNLYEQAFRRVKLLRRDYAEDEDEIEDSDEEELDEEGHEGKGLGDKTRAQAPDTLMSPMGLHLAANEDAASSVDWNVVADTMGNGSGKGSVVDTNSVSGSQNHGGNVSAWASSRVLSSKGVSKAKGAGKHRWSRKNGAAYRKTTSSLLAYVTQFMAPLAALFLLFAVTYATFDVVVKKTIVITAVAAAADKRSSCARQAFVDIRKLSFLTTDGQYITNTYFYVMNTYQCIVDHTRLLTFGMAGSGVEDAEYAKYTEPVENGVATALSPTLAAKVNHAMFSDACPFLADVFASSGGKFNLSDCQSFGGGIVTLGLASLVQQVYRTAYEVGDRQLRGQFIAGSLWEGLGWSVPADTFDYTSLKCTPALGCDRARVVTAPTDASVLPPTFLSDPSYTGDHAAGLSPGVGTIPVGSVPYLITNELNHPQMELLKEADRLYLTPALLAIAQLYRTEAASSINGFISFLAVFVPAYMVAFVLLMITVFQSMIAATNKDIQTKRSMLLYLPVPVVAKARTIRALIAEIIAGEVDGMGLGAGLMATDAPGSQVSSSTKVSGRGRGAQSES